MAAAMLLTLIAASGVAATAARTTRASALALSQGPQRISTFTSTSPSTIPSPTSAAYTATSASSGKTEPSGTDELHRANGIVTHKTTICRTRAALNEYIITAAAEASSTSTSSGKTEPSGTDELHHVNGIVIHKTTICRTRAARVTFADIFMLAFSFTRPLDITAFVFTSGLQPGAS